jgi:beta-lactam-binding protein with PASTA domain
MKLKLPLKLAFLEDIEPRTYTLAAIIAAIMLVVMGIAGLAIFFASLQGEEQMRVPNVQGMDISQALLELQKRELYPRLAQRQTDGEDSGLVLAQDPKPGSIVKAGRRVLLTVSKGKGKPRVEGFIGQSEFDVAARLKSMSEDLGMTLSLRKPVAYRYDQAAAGTVIAQDPAPGELFPDDLSVGIVVSKGPELPPIEMPSLVGKGMAEAMKAVADSGLVADYRLKAPEGAEKPLTVIAQSKEAGAKVERGARVVLSLAGPDSKSKLVSGVLSKSLPDYPAFVRVWVEAVGPDGSRKLLYDVRHPGGLFTMPYVEPAGSILILSVHSREAYRQKL